MPERIQLSICVPTYNYGRFIGQTLDSLLPQITEEVEVVVLDGGSTDDTSQVVAARQPDHPRLSYFYQDFRVGIDSDIESVVSLAKGRYCWLFSADDIMLPGTIDKLLAAIKSDHDIYVCEHVMCNLAMQPISGYPPFNLNAPRTFNLGDALDREAYFRLARTSEAFFSFLAGPIFKKAIWDGANIPESFRGTCWIVAGRLLSMFATGITISYLHEVFLYKREGNDSFSNGSLVFRCKIGIEHFQHVVDVVFGKSSFEALHIRRVLRRDVPLRVLLLAKMRTAEFPEREDIKTLNRLVQMHYVDAELGNWLKCALYGVARPSVLKAAHSLKLSLRQMMR